MGFVSATVMNEGKAAKVAGKSMEANPYPAGSQDSADWLEGYTFDEVEQNVDREDSSDSNRA
jgi:ribosome modulation factor